MNLPAISSIGLTAVLLSACNNSTDTPVVYPETGTPSAKLYQEKCTGCHNAPQPSAHTSRAWFGVLQRMQMRIKAKGMPVLTKNELSEILDYLQKHSATVEPK